MASSDDLRSAFNEDASLYDRMRPVYPVALIEDVVAKSGIASDGRILEIGCGTGQATAAFSERGYAMRCLDMGASLVAFARQKLRDRQNVDFAVTSFEEWVPGRSPYDLVMSATAFHWIDPVIGYPRVASVLKDGGSFALFRHYHPLPGTGFFRDVQRVYEEIAPELAASPRRRGDDPDGRLAVAASVEAVTDQFRESGRFGPVEVNEYPRTACYSPDEYVDLSSTYSDHIALPKAQRRALFNGIKDLVRRNYGVIEKEYLAVLHFARKA